MGTQGPGRKRHPNREKLSAEDVALNQIAREAEARLAAKRAARAEAREIRMKELERQQKEIYQIQKKYYGLDAKWGDIEQWMEDSERYSHRPRRNLQASADEDDLMSVTSRSSLRTNGYEDELLGATQYRKSSRSSTGSGETFQSSRRPPRDETTSAYYSDLSLASASLTSKAQQQSVHNGSRPSLLNCNSLPSRSQRGSLYDEGVTSGSRRSSSSRPPSEYSCYLGSGSRASSRASSARASPVVEERSDFVEKSARPVSSLSAATLASLGGTSSRRGSGDTSISVDTEASIREIKDSLAEVEEKYKRSMVTNAQLDNEKSSLQYQVDTLREVLLELEEELAESRRQYDEKHKECERQKHDQSVLRFQLAEMKDALEQRESLLTKNGIALDSGVTSNGDASLEPHVNMDGPPDPPIRATSMGISEEVEKKETMSVVGEGPPSKTEQDRHGELQNAPPEIPLHAQGGDATQENSEKDINGNTSVELKPADDCTYLDDETHLDQQEEGLAKDSDNVNNEKEMMAEVDHKRVEEEVLEQNFSEVDGEATLNQIDVSPSGSEVFQDALEFVAQTPNAISGLNEEATFCVSDFMNVDHKSSHQEDLPKEDEECKEEHTFSESNINPEEVQIADSEADDTNEIPSNRTKSEENEAINRSQYDHNISCSTEESCEKDLEEKTANDAAITDLEHMISCQEIVKIGEESPQDDLGLQPIGENLAQTENDVETESVMAEKLSVSVESGTEGGRHDVDQCKVFPAPEPMSKDAIVTEVVVPIVGCESDKAFDVPESCNLNKRKSITEDEAVNVGVVGGDSNQDQREDFTDAGSLNTSPKNQENEKPECVFLESEDSKIGEQAEQEKFSDSKYQHKEDDMAKVAENPKEIVPCETFNSEGESTQEGDETDEEEGGAVRSEKYTGESEMPCAPSGSTGYSQSMEDIRMEDSSDATPKRGKGKNKEDCVVS